MAFVSKSKIFRIASVLLGTAWIASFSGAVQADSHVFPYPTFTPEREFVILAPREVVSVSGDFPAQVLLFQHAADACVLDATRVSQRLTRIFAPGGLIEQSLKKLYVDPLAAVRKKNLVIVIDQFGARRDVFTSYYLPSVEVERGRRASVIGLDCSRLSVDYWGPSLAHELSHALLSDQHVDSWFDETLAQLLESDAGGYQPMLEAQAFSNNDHVFPTVLETARPLPSRDHYAITYLFGQYLLERWGGWPMLAAMAGTSPAGVAAAPLCRAESGTPADFLSTIACRARHFYDHATPMPDFVEKLTRSGMLRFFAVAMSLDSPSYGLYSIPHWSGKTKFPDFPAVSTTLTLQPGQFISFEEGQHPKSWSWTASSEAASDLEVYRVGSLGARFEISQVLPGADVSSEVPTQFHRWVTVINLGMTTRTLTLR